MIVYFARCGVKPTRTMRGLKSPSVITAVIEWLNKIDLKALTVNLFILIIQLQLNIFDY